MSQDIDNVMQAAERMRRLDAGDDSQIVDRAFSAVKDRYTLADFALSILPKGKRPVAMTDTGRLSDGEAVFVIIDGKVKEAVWHEDFDDGCFMVPWSPKARQGYSGIPYYEFEPDALLELQYQKLSELTTPFAS